ITFDIQKKLFLIGLPIAVAAFLFSEWLFILVFGERWRTAGQFASILAPYIVLIFTSSSLDQVLKVVVSLRMFLVIYSLRIIGFIMLYLVAIWFSFDFVSFIITLSFYLTLYYFFMSVFILYTVHVYFVR